jgi:hypothetical protein
MIKPSIGRVVWFYLDKAKQTQPFPALISFVHNDRCVNLAYFDASGFNGQATSVTLRQEEDGPLPETGQFCCWMPYQQAQAKKHEGAPS